MLSLVILIFFLIVSAKMGAGYWKSRLAAYAVLGLIAFIQMALVLIRMVKMDVPVGH